jgi:predicted nucleic acid-binding protein
MIVVSDTSPITALLAVEKMELLKQLFGEVVIPNAVETELLRTHPVLPAWLRVQSLQDSTKAKRAQLISSARTLLDELDRKAGIYLSDELKEAALKTVGE